VYVNVFYVVIVECDRGSFKKSLRKEVEFIVEVPVRMLSNKHNVALSAYTLNKDWTNGTAESPFVYDNFRNSRECPTGVVMLRTLCDVYEVPSPRAQGHIGSRFRINGKLHKQNCPINMPFTGEARICSMSTISNQGIIKG
jgi:hypothetical protein